MDNTTYEQVRDSTFNWITNVSGQKVSSTDDLKSGVLLLNTLNSIKVGMITKINTQTATFRQLENIDNFLKAVETLGVSPQDKFQTEDLFYGNNLPKVILTVVALSRALQGQANVPEISADIDALRAFAIASQIDGRKRASSDSQLSLFEMGAKKSQQQASAASRQGDRILLSTEKSIAQGELGFIDTNRMQHQKMISGAKLEGNNIVLSKDTAVASAELGFIDTNRIQQQKMISGAKLESSDIVMSKDTAIASSQLSLFDAKLSENQKMISGAKLEGDSIIMSKDTAVASAELGFIDTNRMQQQKMISGAKLEGDSIIMSKETSVAQGELGLLDSKAGEHQKTISGNVTSGDTIVRNLGADSH